MRSPDMPQTLDIGERIELYSMDKHCRNISIALYRRDDDRRARFLLHTYSAASEAPARISFLKQALRVLLGLGDSDVDADWLCFPCGHAHARALKRAFLDICKLASDTVLAPKPLAQLDKKAECDVAAEPAGDGAYTIQSREQTEQAPRREKAIARGYIKLCEMTGDDADPTRIAFDCGMSHDALIGFLAYRAQNVRAAAHEEEMAASRGVLAAPGQQDN